MFIAKNNDLIILANENREELEKQLQFMVYTSIEESDINYVMYNDSYIPESEIESKERERLNQLSMTRGDVFEALILAKGLTKPQVRAMIENAELDGITKALYLNRFDEALNYYRGFPIFNILGQVLGVTPKQLDDFFETKNYKYLTDITLKVNPTPIEAVVTINGTTTKEYGVPYSPNLGQPVTYKVQLDGYKTVEQTVLLTENITVDVNLEKIEETTEEITE